MWTNLSIKAKLLVSFFAILVLGVIVSFVAISRLHAGATVGKGISSALGSSERIASVNEGISLSSEAIIKYLTPNQQTAENRQQILRSLGKLDQAVGNLNMQGDGEVDKYINELKNKVKEIHVIIENDIEGLVQSHMPYEALEIYLTTLSPKISYISNLADRIATLRLNTLREYTDTLTSQSATYLVIALTILQCILGVAIATIVSNYIRGKLHQQCDITTMISSGNLRVEIDDKGSDEFAVLNRSLIKMRDNLDDSIRKVFDYSNTIIKDMEEVENAANNIASEATSNQNQAVSVASASDEMLSTTTNIARSCEQAAVTANRSTEVTQDGLNLVHDTVDSIHSQNTKMQEDSRNINTLSEQSQKIGSIVGTIDEIASQTNLLALNAAIEAARAGEAGRGFAVVADEVRALASRTTTSTQEISNMILKIQNDTNASTQSMNKSVENMESLAVASSQIQNSLEEIVANVSSVNEQITQIATATEQQTSATAEISSSMQRISESSDLVARAARESQVKAKNANHSLEELMKYLSFFKLK